MGRTRAGSALSFCWGVRSLRGFLFLFLFFFFKSHKIELSIEKYTLTIFHTISEGEKDTSQAAECCLKAQICLFFKWYKQPFFANIVFLSPGLATKTEELPNMKGVNQRFKYAF